LIEGTLKSVPFFLSKKSTDLIVDASIRVTPLGLKIPIKSRAVDISINLFCEEILCFFIS